MYGADLVEIWQTNALYAKAPLREGSTSLKTILSKLNKKQMRGIWYNLVYACWRKKELKLRPNFIIITVYKVFSFIVSLLKCKL